MIGIFLYGPVAVGKLTVAKILSEKLGFKLSHNHLINDLVWSIYDRNTLKGNKFVEELRFRFFEESAKAHANMVTTHAYADDFVSMTGLSDPDYMKQLESIFKKEGTALHFVQLIASDEVILERVEGQSRSDYRKLTDKETMSDLQIENLDQKVLDQAALLHARSS